MFIRNMTPTNDSAICRRFLIPLRSITNDVNVQGVHNQGNERLILIRFTRLPR